jgi:hypothetical protein
MSAYSAGDPGTQNARNDGSTGEAQTTQMVPGMDDGFDAGRSRTPDIDLRDGDGYRESMRPEMDPRDRYRDDYYRDRPYRGDGYGGGRNWDQGRDGGRYRDYDDYDRGRGSQGGGASHFTDEAGRFARQHLRTGETKEFFKTSEFFMTLIGAATLIIAAAVQDTFDAPGMWRLFTALFVAYIVSRGIAKAGSSKSDNKPGNR